jgi:hypothetical protein
LEKEGLQPNGLWAGLALAALEKEGYVRRKKRRKKTSESLPYPVPTAVPIPVIPIKKNGSSNTDPFLKSSITN